MKATIQTRRHTREYDLEELGVTDRLREEYGMTQQYVATGKNGAQFLLQMFGERNGRTVHLGGRTEYCHVTFQTEVAP